MLPRASRQLKVPAAGAIPSHLVTLALAGGIKALSPCSVLCCLLLVLLAFPPLCPLTRAQHRLPPPSP